MRSPGRQRHADPAQHDALAIADGRPVQHQERLRQPLRHRDLELELGIRMRGRGELDALDHLHPGLGLARLAGLGLEAVDERLQVGDLAQLLGAQRALLRHALGAQPFELRVVARVERRRALGQVQGVGGDRVEEVAVVGDHQHHALGSSSARTAAR